MGELTAGNGMELVVLMVLPDEEFERTHSALADVDSPDVIHGIDQAIESAIHRAKRVAREAFERLDPDYRTVVSISPEADTILETARWEGYNHLFIVGHHRSPAGELISRDTTQSTMLNFDGPVTVLLGGASSDDVKGSEKRRSGLFT